MDKNRHPVDELADIRDQLKPLRAREAELREMVLQGKCELVGDDHVVVIKTPTHVRPNLSALQKHLGPAMDRFMVRHVMRQVWVLPRRSNGRGT